MKFRMIGNYLECFTGTPEIWMHREAAQNNGKFKL